jgi:hypothetical protein
VGKTLALVVLCTIGLFTTVTAAQAGQVTNTTVSYAYSGYVPCANGGAGELLTGTIDAHLLETSTSNGNVDGSQFAFQAHGSLVGRITGDTYRLSALERGTYVSGLSSDHYTATYVNRYRLIGPGGGNNLVVKETAHITRDGDDVTVERDAYSIECA